MSEKPFVLTCESFFDWIRSEKEKRGVTSSKLAQISGVSTYSICSYVIGKNPPNLDSAVRIANALGKKIVIVDAEEVAQ